jgi:hypothetical protein
VGEFDELLETLKKAAAVLREAQVPFLLGGGLAAWAHGGPETVHDLDVMVRPTDADETLAALEEVELRSAKPAEDWLYKAWDGDTLVDIIFRPSGGEVDDEMFERAQELDVHAVRLLVMAPEDVLVTKLLSLREHELDYDSVLEIARALREQVDWDGVWERTHESPYARAFFYLAGELDIIARSPASAST